MTNWITLHHVQCTVYIQLWRKCLNKRYVTEKWNNLAIFPLYNLYSCWNTHENTGDTQKKGNFEKRKKFEEIKEKNLSTGIEPLQLAF